MQSESFENVLSFINQDQSSKMIVLELLSKFFLDYALSTRGQTNETVEQTPHNINKKYCSEILFSSFFLVNKKLTFIGLLNEIIEALSKTTPSINRSQTMNRNPKSTNDMKNSPLETNQQFLEFLLLFKKSVEMDNNKKLSNIHSISSQLFTILKRFLHQHKYSSVYRDTGIKEDIHWTTKIDPNDAQLFMKEIGIEHPKSSYSNKQTTEIKTFLYQLASLIVCTNLFPSIDLKRIGETGFRIRQLSHSILFKEIANMNEYRNLLFDKMETLYLEDSPLTGVDLSATGFIFLENDYFKELLMKRTGIFDPNLFLMLGRDEKEVLLGSIILRAEMIEFRIYQLIDWIKKFFFHLNLSHKNNNDKTLKRTINKCLAPFFSYLSIFLFSTNHKFSFLPGKDTLDRGEEYDHSLVLTNFFLLIDEFQHEEKLSSKGFDFPNQVTLVFDYLYSTRKALSPILKKEFNSQEQAILSNAILSFIGVIGNNKELADFVLRTDKQTDQEESACIKMKIYSEQFELFNQITKRNSRFPQIIGRFYALCKKKSASLLFALLLFQGGVDSDSKQNNTLSTTATLQYQTANEIRLRMYATEHMEDVLSWIFSNKQMDEIDSESFGKMDIKNIMILGKREVNDDEVVSSSCFEQPRKMGSDKIIQCEVKMIGRILNDHISKKENEDIKEREVWDEIPKYENIRELRRAPPKSMKDSKQSQLDRMEKHVGEYDEYLEGEYDEYLEGEGALNPNHSTISKDQFDPSEFLLTQYGIDIRTKSEENEGEDCDTGGDYDDDKYPRAESIDVPKRSTIPKIKFDPAEFLLPRCEIENVEMSEENQSRDGKENLILMTEGEDNKKKMGLGRPTIAENYFFRDPPTRDPYKIIKSSSDTTSSSKKGSIFKETRPELSDSDLSSEELVTSFPPEQEKNSSGKKNARNDEQDVEDDFGFSSEEFQKKEKGRYEKITTFNGDGKEDRKSTPNALSNNNDIDFFSDVEEVSDNEEQGNDSDDGEEMQNRESDNKKKMKKSNKKRNIQESEDEVIPKRKTNTKKSDNKPSREKKTKSTTTIKPEKKILVIADDDSNDDGGNDNGGNDNFLSDTHVTNMEREEISDGDEEFKNENSDILRNINSPSKQNILIENSNRWEEDEENKKMNPVSVRSRETSQPLSEKAAKKTSLILGGDNKNGEGPTLLNELSTRNSLSGAEEKRYNGDEKIAELLHELFETKSGQKDRHHNEDSAILEFTQKMQLDEKSGAILQMTETGYSLSIENNDKKTKIYFSK